MPVRWSLQNPSLCRRRSVCRHGGGCCPLPCCAHRLCHPRPRPAWSGRWSPPSTTACCRRSAENTVEQDLVTAAANPPAQAEPAEGGWPHAKPFLPPENPSEPQQPGGVTLGETLAYIHVVAEGGVGSVLQPALVANIIEDTRRHQGVVQHLPGRGVIQAEPPAPAEREGSQQHHHQPGTPGSCQRRNHSSLMSHHHQEQSASLAAMSLALHSTLELLQHMER